MSRPGAGSVVAADPDASGEGGRGAGTVRVSRRRLLRFGLAVLPGLLGARLLSRWAPSLGGDTALAAAAPGSAASVAQPAWAFVCDTSACVGCGLCVRACKVENHVPESPEFNRTWVERHVIATDGTPFVDSPEGGIDGFPPGSTAPGASGLEVQRAFFEPRLCMQCEAAPCVSVCPVGATYRTADGVVLVDHERCIGCGYCVVACPYGARYIVPSGGETPAGIAGVADKCTWCYHRISRGQDPACVEVCPVGARLFGDLNDPDSRVSGRLREGGAEVLKPGLGTKPRVYYLGLDGEVE